MLADARPIWTSQCGAANWMWSRDVKKVEHYPAGMNYMQLEFVRSQGTPSYLIRMGQSPWQQKALCLCVYVCNMTDINMRMHADLEPLHGLGVLVSLDLTGHQQLSSGGRHLLGWWDQPLLAGVSLHRRVGCLAQVVGRCGNHSRLRSQRNQRLRCFTNNLGKFLMAKKQVEGRDLQQKSAPETTVHHPKHWLGSLPPENTGKLAQLSKT